MKHKVVIIDDEPWTREVIVKLTRWQELELELVGEAADGETGVELIREIRPDIIITDVRMPRLSGIELTRILRQEGIENPVLIISGYDDFEYVRSALKLGVTDYLLKPLKADELNQQLKRCRQLLNNKELKADEKLSLGLFADGWQVSYTKIKFSLEAALHIGNREKIKESFKELHSVICEHEGEKPAISIMIGLYYALLFPLQKYAEAMRLDRNELFGTEMQFVFSRDNTLEQLFTYIEKMYYAALDAVDSSRHSRLDIEAVCRYIEEKYLTGVTLEQTADAFHVSKEYLSKAFKAARSEGFSEYVTALRMQKAHELICEYGAPIKEVGAMVGYYDLAHFYKSFKKHFGKTPGEVKSRLKNDKETTP